VKAEGFRRRDEGMDSDGEVWPGVKATWKPKMDFDILGRRISKKQIIYAEAYNFPRLYAVLVCSLRTMFLRDNWR
jgi:hypothetical protein